MSVLPGGVDHGACSYCRASEAASPRSLSELRCRPPSQCHREPGSIPRFPTNCKRKWRCAGIDGHKRQARRCKCTHHSSLGQRQAPLRFHPTDFLFVRSKLAVEIREMQVENGQNEHLNESFSGLRRCLHRARAPHALSLGLICPLQSAIILPDRQSTAPRSISQMPQHSVEAAGPMRPAAPPAEAKGE